MAGIEVCFPVAPLVGAVDAVQKYLNELCGEVVQVAYAETNPSGYYVCWAGFDTEFETILVGKLLSANFPAVLFTDCCLGV